MSAHTTSAPSASKAPFDRPQDSPLQVLAILADLLAAPANRFGKLEFYSEPARTARNSIQLLAVAFNVGPSATVLEQASKVARSALAKAGV